MTTIISPDSIERPITYETPESEVSRHDDGRPGTVSIVLSAEALDVYGLDPDAVHSVSAIVERGVIQLAHQ